jgi:hypothetical protein
LMTVFVQRSASETLGEMFGVVILKGFALHKSP